MLVLTTSPPPSLAEQVFTTTITNHTATEKIELQSFDLPQNYSFLINKLEQLALGLDTALGNLSLDHKEVEIAVSGSASSSTSDGFALGAPILAARAPPHTPYVQTQGNNDVEYSRVVSDIWIGVILTLLIVSVVFFICSCFLYHKFQQWKNSYRTSHNDPVEICRRYPIDFESESLPSYTIVSGLPTYDDAIEEFRKAGIILTPPIPMIKIFDSDSKQTQILNLENALNDVTITNVSGANESGGDNISLSSTCTCTCGAGSGSGSGSSGNSATSTTPLTPNNSMMNLCLPNGTSAANQIIELTPEQLAMLSQKRLSLQIAFNGSVRRNSRPRIDLYRAAARNNHLRARAISNAGLEASGLGPPLIHRSASSNSLSLERHLQHHLQQHRGSLC